MLIKNFNDTRLQDRQLTRMRAVARRCLPSVATVARVTGQVDGEGGITTGTYATVHSTVGRAEMLREPYEVLTEGRLVRKASWRVFLPREAQVMPGDRISVQGMQFNVLGSDVWVAPAPVAAEETWNILQEIYCVPFGDIPNL